MQKVFVSLLEAYWMALAATYFFKSLWIVVSNGFETFELSLKVRFMVYQFESVVYPLIIVSIRYHMLSEILL